MIGYRARVKDDAIPEPSRTIIFFGVDGVGKTTHAAKLSELYIEKSYKIKRCWLRARHSLSYIISKILLRLGYPAVIMQGSTKIMDSRRLPEKRLWSLLEFVSLVPWILTRMILPLLLGYVVIAERYVVDTAVFNRYYIGKEFSIYERIFLKMMPKNALLIHLDADKDELIGRRRGDWPKDFIDYQLRQYRTLASRLQALSINTSHQNIEEVSRIVSSACNIQG